MKEHKSEILLTFIPLIFYSCTAVDTWKHNTHTGTQSHSIFVYCFRFCTRLFLWFVLNIVMRWWWAKKQQHRNGTIKNVCGWGVKKRFEKNVQYLRYTNMGEKNAIRIRIFTCFVIWFVNGLIIEMKERESVYVCEWERERKRKRQSKRVCVWYEKDKVEESVWKYIQNRNLFFPSVNATRRSICTQKVFMYVMYIQGMV